VQTRQRRFGDLGWRGRAGTIEGFFSDNLWIVAESVEKSSSARNTMQLMETLKCILRTRCARWLGFRTRIPRLISN